MLVAALAVLPVSVYALTDVESGVTAGDAAVIEALGVGDDCAAVDGFQSEVECIRRLQAAIKQRIPDMTCADKRQTFEPAAFVARGYGCCFDRARLIEKALAHYGFEIRHLSLHDLKIPVVGYLMPAQSHAASEVLTSKGWMYVDSNEAFLLVTRDGEPVTAEALRDIDWDELVERPVPEPFFRKEPTIFYGLYSRHGFFYPPKVPLPDVDWSQVAFNFGA